MSAGPPEPPAAQLTIVGLGRRPAAPWLHQARRAHAADWNAGGVRIRRSWGRGEFTTPKSRRSVRAVPPPDRVARELAAHFDRSAFSAEHDLVFAHAHSGRPDDESRIFKRFKKAMTVGGLHDARSHEQRHTFGTRMAAVGAPLRSIQEWMGHRDYKTTSIYADYAPDPSQGALYAARSSARRDEIHAACDIADGVPPRDGAEGPSGDPGASTPSAKVADR